MSRRCFPIVVMLMILRPPILTSAKLVAPSPLPYYSCRELNKLSESRLGSGDQPARKRT
jgi:hypothetical protein